MSRIRETVAALLAILLCAGPGFATDEATSPPAGAAPPDEKRAGKDYAPFPQPGSGYVTDHAGLLSDDQEEQIERWLWRTESKTGVEIIVILIKSIKDYPGTPNKSIEEFATALFDKYGIGNMPRNDGVLLLIAKEDRKARIELGAGYGRTRDADALEIMQDVITPAFKEDHYAKGITEGVKAIMLEFAGVRIGRNWTLIFVIIAIPICALIAFSLFRSGKRGWGWVFVGAVFVLVLGAIWLAVQAARHAPRGSSSGWSSGGLGGFGGGFSGGGGATGSW